MRFATDSYFHIGKAHLNSGKPCQDYALADIYYEAALAIVSDGCSTGGKTDVGARILTLCTATAIRDHWAANHTMQEQDAVLEIAMRQKVGIVGARSMLGLNFNDTFATCLYQYMTPAGGLVHVLGDGVTAEEDVSGCITMCRYAWADNRPFYPAYAEDHFAGFIKDHGGEVNANRLRKECWQYTVELGYIQLPSQEITLGEGMGGITTHYSPEMLRSLKFIAVFSDGATQIDGIDWKDVVVQALAFKASQGEFAKRRMRGLIQESQKNGKGPIDDIAYAVTRIIHDEEGGE